ncbi:hypothetical protein AB0M35_08720 [Micromonospora sp. NPDC051196]|uniref:hypothetical protein n=1 Tax=Micromonospora sp. NPDC051196 TaxID=3155281 RepID=UPI00341B2AFA
METSTVGRGRFVADAVAAAAVGSFFGFGTLPIMVLSGFAAPASSGRVATMTPTVAVLTVLVVALVAPLTVFRPRRLSGWWVAAGGLLLTFLVELTVDAGQNVLVPRPDHVGQLLVALLGAAGVGLALGGALLALAQLPGPGRPQVAAALAFGLGFSAIGVLLPGRLLPEPGGPSGPAADDVLIWFALLAAVLAGALARRRVGRPGAPTGEARPGAITVVVGAAVLTIVGIMLREQALPQPSVLDRPDLGAAPSAEFVAAGAATLVGLLLVGYAWRAAGVTGARWVVLGAAAGPMSLLCAGYYQSVDSTAQMLLMPAVGLAASGAGVALARHAPRQVPWDALGLAVAAVMTPMLSPATRAERQEIFLLASLLVAFGIGLALGAGLTMTVTGPAGAGGGVLAALALGPVALVVTTSTLAEATTRMRLAGTAQGTSYAIVTFTLLSALLLAALHALARRPAAATDVDGEPAAVRQLT